MPGWTRHHLLWVAVALASLSVVLWLNHRQSAIPSSPLIMAEKPIITESKTLNTNTQTNVVMVSRAPQETLPGSHSNLNGESGEPVQHAKALNPETFIPDITNVLLPVFGDGVRWNNRTRATLSFYIERLPGNLSKRELVDLGLLIQDQLGEESGEQVAALVKRLYQLRLLEAQQLDSQPPPVSMEESLKREMERIALRREALGQSLYAHLYPSNTMPESITSGGISVDIAQLRQQGESDEMILAYIEEYDGSQSAANYERLRNVEQWWHQRYEVFLQERRLIDSAALDDEEKKRQIDILYGKYYSANEINAAKAYDQIQQSATSPEQ